MDDTIDALGERLTGRHLMDELLGIFRTNRSSNGNGRHLQQRAGEAAGTATQAVLETVKSHPLPTALIGCGIAWLVYERYGGGGSPSASSYGRARMSDSESDYVYSQSEVESEPETGFYAEGEYSRPGPESTQQALFEGHEEEGATEEAEPSRVKSMRRKWQSRSSHLAHKARERIDDASRRVSGMRHRGSGTSSEIGARARSTYRQSRDITRDHPLEAGLMALAGGVLLSLLTPNPRKVDEWVGPYADDAMDRARGMAGKAMDRGRKVATAATETAKSSSREQELTPEGLKAQAEEVADESVQAAKTAASDTKAKAKTVAEDVKDSAREAARKESGEMNAPDAPASPGSVTDRSGSTPH